MGGQGTPRSWPRLLPGRLSSRFLVVGFCASAVVSACGGDATDVVAGQGSTTLATVPASTGTSVVTTASSLTTTSVAPPPTTATTEVSPTTTAGEVVDLSDRPPEDLACVVDHLPVGVGVDAVPVEAAEEAVAQCSRLDVFGEAFVEGLRATYGSSLTEAQYGCLLDGFGRLSRDEMQSLVAATVTPSGEAAGDAAAVVAGLVEGCGVELAS
jgi:hypothetical protein